MDRRATDLETDRTQVDLIFESRRDKKGGHLRWCHVYLELPNASFHSSLLLLNHKSFLTREMG